MENLGNGGTDRRDTYKNSIRTAFGDCTSPLNGLDAEISPCQMRRLATALILIAEEAEAHSVDMPALKRSYPL